MSEDQYQKTLSQIEAISDEIKSTQQLTSALQPLSTLLQLYKSSEANSSEVSNFIEGSEYLNKNYKSWRRVRGDGNCYYRAFLFSLCEKLSSSIMDVKDEYDRINSLIQKSIDEVVEHGYDRFTIETFHEELVDLFSLIKKSNSSESTVSSSSILHTTLNEENGMSDYCTWYLRLLTSIHLQKDPSRFIHFLDGGYVDVKAFCKAEVEPMGKECEMVQVLALAEYLGVKVHIEYLDGKKAFVGTEKGGSDESRLVTHEFGAENAPFVIHLLYRPGHYDILY